MSELLKALYKNQWYFLKSKREHRKDPEPYYLTLANMYLEIINEIRTKLDEL